MQKIRTVCHAAGGWRPCGSREPHGPGPRVVACVVLVWDCAHPVTRNQRAGIRQTRQHGFEIAECSDGMGSVRAFHDPVEFGGAW